MAMSSFVGNFALNGATGNQSVTGVGFQPKAIMFFAIRKSSVGSLAEAGRGIGFATSSSNRRYAASEIIDGNNPSTSARSPVTTKCLGYVTETGTPLFEADFVSMDSDGFTVNVSTTDGANHVIGYLALGGSDLTNVLVGTITPSASTGNQAFTGFGFQPDCMITIAWNGGAASANYGQDISFIAAAASGANATASVSAANPSNVRSIQKSGKALLTTSSASNTISQEATLTSFDSDGVTLNFSTAGTNPIYYLALKGGSYAVGSFNQATSTGNQSVTGLSFQPTAVMMTSINAVTSSSYYDTQMRVSLGVATSSSQRFHVYNGEIDNISTNNSSTKSSSTAIMEMVTPAHASPTTDAVADFVSNDSGGFTHNWSTADATAREILYLAIGPTASAATYVSTMMMMGMGS